MTRDKCLRVAVAEAGKTETGLREKVAQDGRSLTVTRWKSLDFQTGKAGSEQLLAEGRGKK